MPQIVKFDGVYRLPSEILASENSKRFDYIFEEGVWAKSTGGESVSGSGSTLTRTALYRNQLHQFLDLHAGTKLRFFDAPCGDLNWVQEFFDRVDYIGGDISGELVAKLTKQFSDLNLMQFDIIRDEFPEADIWHCRHCLFHLSLEDIYRAMVNFCNSNIDQALITSHFLPDSITFDIPTGSFRFLDLTNFPFYLPYPRLWLLDSEPLSGTCAMASGLWERSGIEKGVENYRKFVGEA